jgi:aminoglycoside phosphotransferase (APT) family kinase protein
VEDAVHGFEDDEDMRRLLRARPPAAALIWAGTAAGGTVTGVRALRGGTASAVHLLTVLRPKGGVHRLVLRRYVRPDVNAEEPDIAAREAQVLRLVRAIDVPTPQLVAVDSTGAEAGVPSVLMSRLPGRLEWSPVDLDRWLSRLAALLPAIHAAPLPPPGVARPFTGYAQERYDPPGWARRPAVWTRAVEIFHAAAPDAPAVFVHRDFHPGNVLWRHGRVSGVVDWASASIGPAWVDVGHCRANLLRYGMEAADRFTAAWEQLAGARFHPWADVITIIGLLDSLRDDPGADRMNIEDVLARAVAVLAGGPP